MVDVEVILAATSAALRAVSEPRFFETERGYQGAFYCTLREELDERGLLAAGCILENEYQKSSRHGLTQRPDVVLHTPAEYSSGDVAADNLVVWALKRGASPAGACEDFAKLDRMITSLRYQLTIFVNVASEQTHAGGYTGPYADQLHCFAVRLVDGEVAIIAENGCGQIQ